MNGYVRSLAGIAMAFIAAAVPSLANGSLAQAVRSEYGATEFSTVSIDMPEEPSKHVRLSVTIDGVLRQLTLQRTSVRGPNFEAS